MAVDGSAAAVPATDSNTASLVRRLVRATLEKDGAGDFPDATVDKLFRLAVRLVGSSLSASVEPDENAAADAIRRRLNRVAAGGAAGIQFADLHRRLSQQPGLRSRWALLHALLQIAEDNETHASDPAAAILVHPLSASAAAGGLPALRDDEPHRGRPAPLSPSRADDSSVARSHRAALAAGDGSTLGLDHPGARAVAQRQLAAESVANLEVGEAELVRDVLFACQGVDGARVRMDPQVDAYVVDPNAPVAPGARRLARKLCEVGWLFRRVRASLGGGDGPSTSGAPSLGIVGGDVEGGSARRAFRAATGS